jgi:hypothetical protein
MKLFLTFLALFAVSTAGPISLTHQQELESIADFLDTVRKIYDEFVQRGSDFVCSAKLQELLDILGLPDKLDGAVELAQEWLCGEKEALLANPQLHDAALKGFRDEVLRIYELAKAYGKDLICGSSLHDLLDLFGVDDRLDGAVKMVQGWICGSSDVVKRSSEVDLVLEASFWETVKRITSQLKEHGVDFVCGAKIQELLDILGVDDRLDSAVKYVQDLLCGDSDETDALAKRSAQVDALQAYGIVWSEIWETLKSWSHDKLCTTKLQDLLDILGFPDALDGAVEMAQNAICGIFSVQKREVVITQERNLQSISAFMKTVKLLAKRLLKNYMKGLICSSRLQQLMDLLDVPDDFDGAVEMAQELICASGILSSSLVEKNTAALQGFIDTIMDVLDQFYERGQDYVCNAGIPELLESFKLPDTMIWAVEIAVDWFCN